EALSRRAECGTDDHLEDHVLAVTGLGPGDIVVRDLVRVAMDLVHERLETRRNARAHGGCLTETSIALAGPHQDALEDAIPEASVRVAHHISAVRLRPPLSLAAGDARRCTSSSPHRERADTRDSTSPRPWG